MSDSEKHRGCCVSCRHVIVNKTLVIADREAEPLYKREYFCSVALDRVTGEPLPCRELRMEFSEACGVTGTNWERKE